MVTEPNANSDLYSRVGQILAAMRALESDLPEGPTKDGLRRAATEVEHCSQPPLRPLESRESVVLAEDVTVPSRLPPPPLVPKREQPPAEPPSYPGFPATTLSPPSNRIRPPPGFVFELLSASENTGLASDPTSVLQTAEMALVRATGATSVHLCIRDQYRSLAAPAAFEPPQPSASSHPPPTRMPSAETLLKEHQSIVILSSGQRITLYREVDSYGLPEAVGLFRLFPSAAACVGLPLRLHGTCVGVVWMLFQEPREFSSAELEVLQLYANQAAVAFNNASLLQQTNRLLELTTLSHGNIIRQTIVDEITAAARCDVATLFVYNPTRDELDLKPTCTRDALRNERGIREYGRERQDTVIRNTRELTQPLYLSDCLTQPYFCQSRFTEDERIRSCAVLPLVHHGTRVGIAFANYRKTRVFGTDQKAKLEHIAQKAAATISDVLVLERTSSPRPASQVDPDLKRQLDAIIEMAATLLSTPTRKCTGGVIYLSEENGVRYRLVAQKGIDTSVLQPGDHCCAANEGMVGTLMGRAQRYLLTNDYPNENYRINDAVASQVRAAIQVPMSFRNRDIGVLGVISGDHSAEFEGFTEADVPFLERLAESAALAIQNVKHFESERERALSYARLLSQTETLASVSRAIRESLELEEVADRILDGLDRLVGYDRATLQLFTSDGQQREKIATRGCGDSISPNLLRPINEDQLVRSIVYGDKTAVVLSETDDPRWEGIWERFPETGDVLSWVGVPLYYGAEAIGLLTLDHKTRGYYGQDVRPVLEAFADQAAIAIANSLQLNELSGAWLSRVTTNHQIAAGLSEALDLAQKSPSGNSMGDVMERIRRSLWNLQQVANLPLTDPCPRDASPLPLRDVLEAWASSENSRLSDMEVQVQTGDAGTPDVWCLMNERWLRSVLTELASNARKAIRDGTRPKLEVSIGLSERRGQWEIRVRDQGRGIDPNIKATLFTPRVRPRMAPSSDERGTGRGLFLARRMLRIYGGDLWVDETPLQGTTVVVAVPRGREPGQESVR